MFDNFFFFIYLKQFCIHVCLKLEGQDCRAGKALHSGRSPLLWRGFKSAMYCQPICDRLWLWLQAKKISTPTPGPQKFLTPTPTLTPGFKKFLTPTPEAKIFASDSDSNSSSTIFIANKLVFSPKKWNFCPIKCIFCSKISFFPKNIWAGVGIKKIASKLRLRLQLQPPRIFRLRLWVRL